MYNKKKIFSGILLYFSFVSAGEAVYCNLQKVSSPNMAKQCTQDIIDNHLQEVFQDTHIKPHLSDLTQCTSKTHVKSYFSHIQQNFIQSFGSVQNCFKNNQRFSWNCSVNPGATETCLVSPSGVKGKLQHNNSCFAINERGFLLTVYPQECAPNNSQIPKNAKKEPAQTPKENKKKHVQKQKK